MRPPGVRTVRAVTVVAALAAVVAATSCSDGDSSAASAAAPTAASTAASASVPSLPPMPTLADSCGAGARGFRRVVLTTADGVRLRGATAGSGPVTVVFAHQTDDDLCAWLPYARGIARGHRVLAIDFRAKGGSDGAPGAGLGRYDRDVVAAVRWARGHGAKRVVLVGASMGGTAVLSAAGSVPVDAVVSLSGPSEWPDLDPRRVLAARTTPVALVAATDDVEFADGARALNRMAKGRPGVSLTLVPGSAHGVQLADPSDAAGRRVDAIIRRAIAGAG